MQLPNINASLTSTGRSNGTPYTDAERALAVDITKTVLTATGHGDHDIDNDEVADHLVAIAEQKGDNIDVPGLCRGVYRSIEKERLSDDNTTDDFPKQKNGERVGRDHTSINNLFRKAFEQCGVEKETIDKVFPSYSSNKKKAS